MGRETVTGQRHVLKRWCGETSLLCAVMCRRHRLSAWVMAKEGWPVMFTDMAYESPLSAHTVAITSG